ncbi:MAG: DUF4367 domain-containing protein [Clostridia bacterium]
MKNAYDYLNDTKVDLSRYEKEEITEREILRMKARINNRKGFNTKKFYLIAACAAFILIAGTCIAAGYIREASTGHNQFVLYDSEDMELPKELRGKLFDKDGNEVKYMKEYDELYDKNGEVMTAEKFNAIYKEAYGDDVAISVSGDDYDPNEAEFDFASIEDAQKTANFDIKVPKVLPEGYSLARVYAYKDENGTPSGDYITLVYKRGETDIYIFERIINEETAFATGTDGTMEVVEINGQTAVIMDNRSIDWETEDDVSVGISGRGHLTREELINMAKNTK